MLALADVPHVLDEAAMRELDALRRRGRPRRVEDVGDIVGLDGALRGVELGVGRGGAEIPERVERRQRTVRLASTPTTRAHIGNRGETGPPHAARLARYSLPAELAIV